MSLQIWLPLNGNLTNQGLDPMTFSNTNTSMITVNSSGKIGSCYTFNSTAANYGIYGADITAKHINNKSWSLCAWVKSTATDTIVLSLSYGLRLFIGSSVYISLYNSSRTVNCSTSKSTTDGLWHHIVATYDVTSNIVSIYFDGVKANSVSYTSGYTYASSWTNGTYIGRDPNNNTLNDHYHFKGSMNDVRIYDHCLSAKEVKEISKGLVLHYKLDDRYIEPTTNIAPYPTLSSSSYTPGWDTTKHPGAITVSGWSTGYNSGVSSPSTGYHAYWRLIDGIPNIIFPDKNSEISQTHRWLGVSAAITSTLVGLGITYTISMDARADVEGKIISTGIYHRKTDNTSYSFYEGCTTKTISTKWERYSWTYTSGSTYDTSGGSSIYIYGHYGTEGIAYVRNIQIEIDDHATPYTPSSRSDSTVYDCSGYGYSGTKYGAITCDSNTPRYSASYKLVDSATAINIGNLSTYIGDGIFTFNIWFKKTTGEWSTKNWETILGGPSGFELEVKRGSTNSPVLVAYSWGQSSSGGQTYTLDTWHMVTMVRTSSETKFYLDGQWYYTGSVGSIPSGNYFIGAWSTSSGQNFRGHLSDARIYATALSADDIKELYDTSASIDNQGNIYAYEYKEI